MENLNEIFMNEMKKRHEKDGAKDCALAAELNVSQSYITELRNGKKKFILPDTQKRGGISLRLFLRLFPGVEIAILKFFQDEKNKSPDGSFSVSGSRNVLIGNGSNNHVDGADASYSKARLEAALDAVLNDANICDKCRVAAAQHIRKATRS